MYASNEDEFNRDESDWVVLRQTPPTNTVSGLTFFCIFCILFIYIEDSSGSCKSY
jgi:hypothetical protein